jgi:acetyltransferase-like isoleucine patch superfamily enzyme
MQTVTLPQELSALENGNRFCGAPPVMDRSTVRFAGKNNVLFCEEGVRLSGTTIDFNGDNAVVYLCRSRHPYKLSVNINHDNVLYFGRDNYINQVLHVILSEQKHVFVGNGGLFSLGIWIRTADPHLIYDENTLERINPSQSVYIGDHVWIGQSTLILKGTRIDSGSILGGMSVVAGKRLASNASYGGDPCRLLRRGVFWEGSCVHNWDADKTAQSRRFPDFVAEDGQTDPTAFLYAYDPAVCVDYDALEAIFDGASVDGKIACLRRLTADPQKNRFVHPLPPEKMTKKEERALLDGQQAELDAAEMYRALAKILPRERDKAAFFQLTDDETRHAAILRGYTGQDRAADPGKSRRLPRLYRLLGRKRLYRQIAKREDAAAKRYAGLIERFPHLAGIAADEHCHAQAVLALLDGEKQEETT